MSPLSWFMTSSASEPLLKSDWSQDVRSIVSHLSVERTNPPSPRPTFPSSQEELAQETGKRSSVFKNCMAASPMTDPHVLLNKLSLDLGLSLGDPWNWLTNGPHLCFCILLSSSHGIYRPIFTEVESLVHISQLPCSMFSCFSFFLLIHGVFVWIVFSQTWIERSFVLQWTKMKLFPRSSNYTQRALFNKAFWFWSPDSLSHQSCVPARHQPCFWQAGSG